jgi:hypothetical protein
MVLAWGNQKGEIRNQKGERRKRKTNMLHPEAVFVIVFVRIKVSG